MIKINRGVEPPGLRRARNKTRLRRAVAAYQMYGAPSKELTATLVGYGSGATKRALYLAQHKKCVWCERRRDLSSSPVEHYRPKDGAWRHARGQPQVVDHECYWWLTWTWENLFFSCPRCNDAGHKANFFPLRPTTVRLPTPTAPTSYPPPPAFFSTAPESPLLVDPASVDPMRHIWWTPVSRRPPRKDWLWVPRGITPEGAETVKILRLDELADEGADYLRVAVLPFVEIVEEALVAGNLSNARSKWSELLLRVLAPEASFRALTYGALSIWVAESVRVANGLQTVPRP